ncbi:hypothetical protein [Lysinibacillus sp. NPDC056232]|uniref:hypothetical protein n=1 Tax=Lysinibacillus sp. NPDC056232 TaxID=3345756 RepID=UPI0035DDCAF0
MSRFTRGARSRVSGQHDVGHEGVITGRDGFSLRSSIANPQGVAQPSLQSTYIWHMFTKCHLEIWTLLHYIFYKSLSVICNS